MFGRQYLTFVFDNTRDSRLQSSSKDASCVNPNINTRGVTLPFNSVNSSCETTCLGCSDCASDQDAAQVREYFEMCLKAAEKQPSEDVIGVAALLPLCEAWVLPKYPVFRDSFQTKSYIHTILSRCNGKSYSSFPWFDGCKHERWEVLSFNPGVAVMSSFLAG